MTAVASASLSAAGTTNPIPVELVTAESSPTSLTTTGSPNAIAVIRGPLCDASNIGQHQEVGFRKQFYRFLHWI